MIAYAIRRIALIIPTLFAIMVVNFVIVQAAPGGPVEQMISRLKGSDVSATERVPALPDVPTIADAGVPGFEAVGWTLVCVPAATPKPIQAKLGEALDAAAHTPEVQALMQQLASVGYGRAWA